MLLMHLQIRRKVIQIADVIIESPSEETTEQLQRRLHRCAEQGPLDDLWVDAAVIEYDAEGSFLLNMRANPGAVASVLQPAN